MPKRKVPVTLCVYTKLSPNWEYKTTIHYAHWFCAQEFKRGRRKRDYLCPTTTSSGRFKGWEARVVDAHCKLKLQSWPLQGSWASQDVVAVPQEDQEKDGQWQAKTIETNLDEAILWPSFGILYTKSPWWCFIQPQGLNVLLTLMTLKFIPVPKIYLSFDIIIRMHYWLFRLIKSKTLTLEFSTTL